MTVTSKYKYRSGLEQKVAAELEGKGAPIVYEETSLKYEVPAREASYTPDFHLPDGSFLEVKGYLRVSDRTKMLNVVRSEPGLKIRFLFGNSSNRLHKNSQTTYGQWATHHGFEWCNPGQIPESWLRQPTNDNIDKEVRDDDN